MSTNKINVIINGSELSIDNPSADQLTAIISALNNQQKTIKTETANAPKREKTSQESRAKSVKVRNRARAKVENHQLNSDRIAIYEDFDIEKAVNSKTLAKSFDTGKLLSKSSKQLKARQEVVWLFADNGNKPLTVSGICEPISKQLNLTFAATSNYISQCARLGVLAKDKDNSTYYLSRWFIEQVNL